MYLAKNTTLVAEIAHILTCMFPAPVQVKFVQTEHVNASWIGPNLLALEISTTTPIEEAKLDATD